MHPIRDELYAPANANGPTMRPFSKCTAVRTPSTSRFNLISLGHSAVDDAPPIVSGIAGSFRLSKIAARKEFRNCSLTVIVASAAGELLTRRPRVAFVSWAFALTTQSAVRKAKNAEATDGLTFITESSLCPMVPTERRSIWSAPAERSADGAVDLPT